MKINEIAIPNELTNRINDLKKLEKHGWSKEWQNEVQEITIQLIDLRESSDISQDEFNYIRDNYLKSYGIISNSNISFFSFIIKK